MRMRGWASAGVPVRVRLADMRSGAWRPSWRVIPFGAVAPPPVRYSVKYN